MKIKRIVKILLGLLCFLPLIQLVVNFDRYILPFFKFIGDEYYTVNAQIVSIDNGEAESNSSNLIIQYSIANTNHQTTLFIHYRKFSEMPRRTHSFGSEPHHALRLAGRSRSVRPQTSGWRGRSMAVC